MRLTTVQSKAIHAIGYDQERLLLEIVFNSGGIYRYAHVPPQIFLKFLHSPSKGRFFQQHIRGVFAAHRISRRRVKRRPVRPIEKSPMEDAI